MVRCLNKLKTIGIPFPNKNIKMKKMTEILQNMLSHHNGVKLKISNRGLPCWLGG